MLQYEIVLLSFPFPAIENPKFITPPPEFPVPMVPTVKVVLLNAVVGAVFTVNCVLLIIEVT